MENSRVVATVEDAAAPPTTAWKDFTALIKIGIVNSNLITTFTGLWLALIFTGNHFLQSLRYSDFHIIGIVAHYCRICCFE